MIRLLFRSFDHRSSRDSSFALQNNSRDSRFGKSALKVRVASPKMVFGLKAVSRVGLGSQMPKARSERQD